MDFIWPHFKKNELSLYDLTVPQGNNIQVAPNSLKWMLK